MLAEDAVRRASVDLAAFALNHTYHGIIFVKAKRNRRELFRFQNPAFIIQGGDDSDVGNYESDAMERLT